ncbi:hypothetical protein PENSPDRAFT_654698 [Peniophora sp. CONT]|nr:hypothetical protein PENSPDRAFT_654698 [Peniophora sp. CONT]
MEASTKTRRDFTAARVARRAQLLFGFVSSSHRPYLALLKTIHHSYRSATRRNGIDQASRPGTLLVLAILLCFAGINPTAESALGRRMRHALSRACTLLACFRVLLWLERHYSIPATVSPDESATAALISGSIWIHTSPHPTIPTQAFHFHLTVYTLSPCPLYKNVI